MSSIKDEIDWEFPGNQTTQGQTNFFWQGVIREFLLLSFFVLGLILGASLSSNSKRDSVHMPARDYEKLPKLPV